METEVETATGGCDRVELHCSFLALTCDQLVAKKLAAIAHKYGESETGDTPYADLAKAAGVPYEGGRREDVTVIVAYVEDPDDF